MRYFLGTKIDKASRDYMRDFIRTLSKYKRSLSFPELEQLHFNYKYLGQNVPPTSIGYITESVQETIDRIGLYSFDHPMLPIRLGEKLEYQPNTIKLSLKPNEELNLLYRLLQEAVVKLELPEIVRRKDTNNLLGVIKVGEISSNLSAPEREKLAQIISEFPSPPPVRVENISIITTDVERNKVKVRYPVTINLKDAIIAQ